MCQIGGLTLHQIKIFWSSEVNATSRLEQTLKKKYLEKKKKKKPI